MGKKKICIKTDGYSTSRIFLQREDYSAETFDLRSEPGQVVLSVKIGESQKSPAEASGIHETGAFCPNL